MRLKTHAGFFHFRHMMKTMLGRRALWLLPALVVLILLGALLVLADGGALSVFGYKSF